MTATIAVNLKKDRTELGSLVATGDDGIIAGPFSCLAISDIQAAVDAGNPSRDPIKPEGNLPTGTYRCNIVGPGLPVHSYGPGQRIELTGIAGDALTAMLLRSGLLDHGGDLNPAYVGWEGLRPTHGCCRLRNEDIAALIAVLAEYDEILQIVTEN